MAEQTIQLPSSAWSTFDTISSHGWGLPANSRPVIIDALKVNDSDVRVLDAVIISSFLDDADNNTALVYLEFGTSQTADVLSGNGSDLSSTFEESGGIDITVGGFTYSFDLAGADTTEPYSWTPGNVAEALALYRAVNSATDATLVIRDGPRDPSRDPSGDLWLAGNLPDGIYKSTDGGANWSGVLDPPDGQILVTGIAVDPRNGDLWLAGSSPDGIYKSTDGGANWGSLISGPSGQAFVSGISVDPRNGDLWLSGSVFGGLYKSTDGGANWGSVISPPDGQVSIQGVAVDPRNGDLWIAGNSPHGIYKSTDGGANWGSLISVPSAATTITGIAIDPRNGDLWISSRFPHGLYRSTDGGANWSASINPPSGQTSVADIAVQYTWPLPISLPVAGIGTLAVGSDAELTVATPVTYQVFELPAAIYGIQDFGFRWRYAEANRPAIIDALKRDSDDDRFFEDIVFRRDRSGFVWNIAEDTTSPFSQTGNLRLSDAFESTGVIHIAFNDGTADREWSVTMGSRDTDEPYRIDFTGDEAATYNTFRDYFPTTGTLAATLTVWDGTGESPFADEPTPVRVAGIGTLVVSSDSALTVTSPAPDAVAIAGIGTLVVSSDTELTVSEPTITIPVAGIGTLAVGADSALTIVEPLPVTGIDFTIRYSFNQSGSFIAAYTSGVQAGSLDADAFDADNFPAGASDDPTIAFVSANSTIFSSQLSSVFLVLGALNINVDGTLVVSVAFNSDIVANIRIQVTAVGGSAIYEGRLLGTSETNYASFRLTGDGASDLYDFARESSDRDLDVRFYQITPRTDLNGGIGSLVVGADSSLSISSPASIRAAGIGSSAVSADSSVSITSPASVSVAGIGSLATSSDTELSVIPPVQIDIAGALRQDLYSDDLQFSERTVSSTFGIRYTWFGGVTFQGQRYGLGITLVDGRSLVRESTVSISLALGDGFDYSGYRMEIEDSSGAVGLDISVVSTVTATAVTGDQLEAILGDTPANPGNRELTVYFPQTATIPTPAIASDTELNVIAGAAINPAGIGSLAITSDTALNITPATPVRVAGVSTLAFGADSQLQIDSSSAIRAQGIGTLTINSDTALAVVPPTAIRPAGIPSLAVASDSELYVDPASATRIRGVGTEAIDAETELSVVEPTPARPAGIPSLVVTVGSQLRVLATAAIRLAGIGTAAFSAEAVAQVIPPTTISPSGIATAAVSVDSALNVIRRVAPDSTTDLPLTIRHPKLSRNFWSTTTSDLEQGAFSYAVIDTSDSRWPADEDDIALWLYRSEISTTINRVDGDDPNSAIENVFINFDLFNFFPTLTDFSFLSINNVDFNASIRDNMKVTVVTSTAVTLFEGDYPAGRRIILEGADATVFADFEAASDIYMDVTWALKRTNVNGGFGSLAITGDSAIAAVPPTPVSPGGVASAMIDSDAGLDITRPDEVRIGGARRSNLAMLTMAQSTGVTVWSFGSIGFQITAAPALRLFGTGQYRADATARFDITHPTTGLVFEALLSDYPDGRNAGITQAQYDAIFGPGTNVNNLDSRGFAPYLPDTTETPSAVVSVDTALDITTPTSVRIAGIGSVAFSGDSVLQISSILQILPITVILPWSSTNTWVSDPANTEQRLFAGTAANRAITVSRSARNLSVSITGDTDFADEVEDEGVIFSLYLGGRTFVLFEDVTEDHPYTYRISIAERNALRGANPDETLLAMVFTRPPPIYVPEAIGEEGFSTDSALVVTRVAAVSVSGIGSEAVTAENVIRVFRVAGVRLGGIGTVAFAADSAVSTITPATIRLAGIATLDITVDAPRLQIDGPGNIRIAGAGFLPVSVDSEVRAVRPIGVGVAGIGSLAFAGDSALVVEESEIPIPEGITEGSTGDITFGDYRLQWSQGFDETYRFRTGIITHRGGTEQRIAHRSRPRVEYEFTAFLDPVEMRTFLARNSANQGALTYFPHPRDTVVSPTELGVGASFVSFDPVPGWLNAGSSLFVRFGQYVIPGVALGIDAAGALLAFSNPAPLPAGTLIYRGAPARPSSSPSIAAATSRVGTMQLRVDGDPVDNWLPTYPATAPVALDGKEYFDLGPNWNDGVSIGMPEEWEDIDFERGAVSRRFPNLFPKRLLQYRYLLHTPERIEHVLGLFFRMRGRQKSFYMPSFVHEATLAENTTRTQFTVPGNQFFRTYADSPVFKWLRIVHQAGVYLVEVDSITQTDEGNSEVTLTDQMPASLTSAEIRMISWVNLVRFETDSLTVNWRTDGVAETRLNLRTLEVELPA